MSNPNFIKIHPAVLELKHADRCRTCRTSPIIVHFVYTMQRMHNTHKNKNNNNNTDDDDDGLNAII
jgi:hypothetical protein